MREDEERRGYSAVRTTTKWVGSKDVPVVTSTMVEKSVRLPDPKGW